MRLKNAGVAACAILLLAAVVPAGAQKATNKQDKSKRPSPPGTAACSFEDGKKITVDYSRPSMRGRKIMGGLVPYGIVWRTGANDATSFVTDADLTIEGVGVPRGSYTLYTLPSDQTWKLIINKQTGQWGTKYDEKQDVARVDLKKDALETPVEQFTISFAPAGSSCAMKLEWEQTRLSANFHEKK
jgi:Protein of unknown function (DUF2911)